MANTLHIRQPVKRRKYDEAFKAEALRLAWESRLARAAAQQVCIREALLYRWRRADVHAEGHRVGAGASGACW